METLYFAGQPGTGFGWGICNRHLLEELSRIMPVCPIDASGPLWHSPNLPGILFTPLQDHDFNPATPARGIHNYGYTFFENELTGQAQDLDEILDRIEYAYHHRDAIKQLGRTAEADMRRLTWAKTAQTVLHTLHPPPTSAA